MFDIDDDGDDVDGDDMIYMQQLQYCRSLDCGGTKLPLNDQVTWGDLGQPSQVHRGTGSSNCGDISV